MTKEESIKRVDDIISHLKNIILDIELQKQYFIDYDESNDSDDIDKENLFGMSRLSSKYVNFLYYKPCEFFTKTVLPKE